MQIPEGTMEVVQPYKNNIHCFYANQDSIILDLIVNDYDSGRVYKEFVRTIDKNVLDLGIFLHGNF